MIRLKRVYESPSKEDGIRILVERLWPRGLTREQAAFDMWWKEIAPSTELRRWFAHIPERWDEFCVRYTEELSKNQKVVQALWSECKGKKVTLIFAAKDELRNSAVVLKKFLESL